MSEAQDSILVVPDFSQVSDRIEPGIYKARITASEVGSWEGREGKPSTRYVKWTFETFDEAESKNNGRKIWMNTAIEGKGAFRLQDLYRAATGIDLSGSFDRTTLHGCEVQITVAPQKNEPQYTEVKSVKPITH